MESASIPSYGRRDADGTASSHGAGSRSMPKMREVERVEGGKVVKYYVQDTDAAVDTSKAATRVETSYSYEQHRTTDHPILTGYSFAGENVTHPAEPTYGSGNQATIYAAGGMSRVTTYEAPKTGEQGPVTTTYTYETTSAGPHQPSGMTTYAEAKPYGEYPGATTTYTYENATTSEQPAITYTYDAMSREQQANVGYTYQAAKKTEPVGTTFSNERKISGTASAAEYVSSAYATGTMASVAQSTSSVQRPSGSPPTIRREIGEKRLVSQTERVDESRSHVISETVTEHSVRIPRRVIREDVIERVIIVPERRKTEHVEEEDVTYRERIIKRAKPVIVEKVIEVPEIEYVERPVVQYVDVESVHEIERVTGEPEVIEIQKKTREPVYVDVQEEEEVIEYEDVVRERKVPVPREVEKVVIQKERVPRPVKVVRQRDVKMPKIVRRKLPIPVTVESQYEYRLPHLRPVYTKMTFPLYVPRFIEVPMPTDMLSQPLVLESEKRLTRLKTLTTNKLSLAEVERLAEESMKAKIEPDSVPTDAQTFVQRAWESGTLKIDYPTAAA